MKKLADVDGILNTELVKGQFATGGQFQIIIGSGTVDEVYKYFIQYAELQESSKKEVKQAADQKMNPLQRLVKCWQMCLFRLFRRLWQVDF